MRRIANLLTKDLLLGIKDVFILLEIGFAVVLVLLLIFIVPERLDNEQPVYIADDTGVLSRFVQVFAGSGSTGAPDAADTEETAQTFVEDRDAVVGRMVEDRSAMGLVLARGQDAFFQVDLLTQPYTPPAVSDFVGLEIADVLSVALSPGFGYPVEIMDAVRVSPLEEAQRATIPFNQRILPLALLFMVGILGLFSMVSLIGQERGDQTLRALRVSPASLWQFLAGKHLTLLITGMATFSILYIPMLGFSGYLRSLLLMVLTILIGSSLGAILGTFFSNPMASMGWVFLVMVVFGLPGVSLLAPIFDPPWLALIPTYHTLFGLDAAMFSIGDPLIVWRSAAVLAAFALVLVFFSGFVFTRRAGREV